ncbi:MAG: Rieske [2Fe-2S] iron-sulfur protein [Gemmatimonadetes bacterium]|nr:Rieske [2Fe-2S] iron-sulfur protein [Gemmatimonadota bacterium]
MSAPLRAGPQGEPAVPSSPEGACAGCGMGRRAFVGRSAMAVAAVLLAACGAGGGDGGITQPGTGGTFQVTLAGSPQLATAGGIATFSTPSGRIAVVRETDGGLVALSLRCPHQGTTVNPSGTGFLCPNHGARFDAHGTWQGGQRTSSLTVLASTLDPTTGVLTVQL